MKGHTKPPPGRPHWVSGLLGLAGSVAAAYFLLLRGLAALLLVTAVGAFASIFPEEQSQQADAGGFVTSVAVMAAVGLVLSVGLLVVGVLRLSGRPLPGRRACTAFLVLSLGLVGSTWLLAQRATAPAPVPPGYAGLEGIWSEASSPKLTYRLNPDGTVYHWWEGLGHGKSGSWSRTGQTVTIRSDRDWQLVGTLGSGTITGTLSVTSTGAPIAPVVWVRK